MGLFGSGKKAPVKKVRIKAPVRKPQVKADPFDMGNWKVLGSTKVTRASWKR